MAEALALDRKWGYAIKDKKKYNREPPNKHALDEEIEEGLKQCK